MVHKTWIESTFYSKLHLDYMPISLCQSYTYTNPIVNQPTSSCQLQILYPLVYSKHYIHEVSCIILKWPNNSHHPWTDYSYPLGQQCFQNQISKKDIKLLVLKRTYSFPAIWIQESGNLGVESRNWPWLSSNLSSDLLNDMVGNLSTFVYIISANSNLEWIPQ